jgi:hypothetical protein
MSTASEASGRSGISYHPPEAAVLVPLFAALILGAPALAVAFLDAGQLRFLVILWLAGMSWLAYNYLVRLAREVVVTGERLFWSNYFTTIELPLSDVVRLRSASFGLEEVVECRDGRRLRVRVRPGYRPFIEAVARAHPDLPIELGAYSGYVGPREFVKFAPIVLVLFFAVVGGFIAIGWLISGGLR